MTPAPTTAKPATGKSPASPTRRTAAAGDVRLAERARQVRRNRRWRRAVRLAAWIAVPVAAVLAAWLLLGSGWFSVRTVQVAGVERVSDRLVVLTADVATGTPLARVDLDQVRQRVEDLPAVASASARRVWPDTVRIDVVERVAALAAPVDGARWALVDAEGVAFATVDDPPAGVLRVAGGSTDQASKPQGGEATVSAAVAAAAAVAASLPSDLAAQVTAIDPRSADDVRLALSGGAQVRWGSAAEPARKAAILAVLMQRPARVYDVSTPQSPTTA